MLRVFRQKIIRDNITDESYYLFEGRVRLLRPRGETMRVGESRVREDHGRQGRVEFPMRENSHGLPSNMY